jgi:ApaG protein
MSDTTTQGVRIQVAPKFWPERSVPDRGQWAFTYAVTVTNTGERTVTLRRRHWIIFDGTGHAEEVRGEGVVGKQPRLEPGESFEYTSWAMLRTPYGAMRGSYTMERTPNDTFEAKIAEFSLTMPNALN